jgi:protein-S-isoprenylcysteine O-methyltransferase Ste14
MLGWAVALVCYDPFWSVIGNHYLNYETPYKWGAWLEQYPVLYVVWGSSILLLVFIYVWATISFGARFSNLTHRGIITNGPYRWTKHPAYVAKNLSWWMIAIPFIAGGTPMICLRNCLMLLGLNGIYFLRAKTEEWHLSRDPTYRSYADWIAEHGLFRWVNPARMFKSLIR